MELEGLRLPTDSTDEAVLNHRYFSGIDPNLKSRPHLQYEEMGNRLI